MKPDMVNVIVRRIEENGKSLMEFTEAGTRLDSTILSWIFMAYADRKIRNVKYQLDGGWNYVFSAE
jgi:hypothetical protein